MAKDKEMTSRYVAIGNVVGKVKFSRGVATFTMKHDSYGSGDATVICNPCARTICEAMGSLAEKARDYMDGGTRVYVEGWMNSRRDRLNVGDIVLISKYKTKE